MATKLFLSESQFMAWIKENVKTATPATVVTRTDPKFNKYARTRGPKGEKFPNPWLDRVYKVSKHRVFLNYIYENSVNRQREREGKESDFHAQQRSWGVHDGRCLVFHEGTWYLNYKLEGSEYEYRRTDDDSVIDVSELTEYLPPVSHSVSQGTDKEIRNINVKLGNVLNVVVNKHDITLIH